jgi:hypothetical protein
MPAPAGWLDTVIDGFSPAEQAALSSGKFFGIMAFF